MVSKEISSATFSVDSFVSDELLDLSRLIPDTSLVKRSLYYVLARGWNSGAVGLRGLFSLFLYVVFGGLVLDAQSFRH